MSNNGETVHNHGEGSGKSSREANEVLRSNDQAKSTETGSSRTKSSERVKKFISAEKYVGVLVSREFDGETYIGKVQGFNKKKGLFKIVYDNGVVEKVDKEGYNQLSQPKELLCDYLDRMAQKRLQEGKTEPKTKKAKSNKTGNSKYIPLVFKERKHDIYRWYKYG